MELLWALAYFGAVVILHALFNRLPFGNPIVKFLALGGLGGCALVGHLLWQQAALLPATAAVLSFAFLCEIYLFLFTMVASSVSARLLLLFREKDLATGDIRKLYDTADMVQKRVLRLSAAGLVVIEAKGCRLTPKGNRLVKVFVASKRFFRHA